MNYQDESEWPHTKLLDEYLRIARIISDTCPDWAYDADKAIRAELDRRAEVAETELAHARADARDSMAGRDTDLTVMAECEGRWKAEIEAIKSAARALLDALPRCEWSDGNGVGCANPAVLRFVGYEEQGFGCLAHDPLGQFTRRVDECEWAKAFEALRKLVGPTVTVDRTVAKRCDDCSPCYGCFDGSSLCCKRSPVIG